MSNEAADAVACLADLVRAAQLPKPAERKRIREAAGLSLQRFAGVLGVTPTAVWNWEHGKDGPSLENAVKYRQLLDQLAAAVRDKGKAS